MKLQTRIEKRDENESIIMEFVQKNKSTDFSLGYIESFLSVVLCDVSENKRQDYLNQLKVSTGNTNKLNIT